MTVTQTQTEPTQVQSRPQSQSRSQSQFSTAAGGGRANPAQAIAPKSEWWQKQLQSSIRFCKRYPVIVAIGSITLFGAGGVLLLGRSESPVVTSAVIPGRPVPPAPTNQVDASRAMAQQMMADRDKATQAVMERLQQELRNIFSQRSREYLAYANSVYQQSLKDKQEGRSASAYASPQEVLYGIAAQKQADITTAQSARDPVAAMSALMEAYACAIAIRASVNPVKSEPLSIAVVVDSNDTTQMPAPLVLAGAISSWRNSLMATSQAMQQAHQAMLAAQQQTSQQSATTPPVQPVSAPAPIGATAYQPAGATPAIQQGGMP